MPSSGQNWVLNKLAELSVRFGVSPAVADFSINLHFNEDVGRSPDYGYFYTLDWIDGNWDNADEEAKIAKMTSLLGIEGPMSREFPDLLAVEKAVDRALSLAPRARSR